MYVQLRSDVILGHRILVKVCVSTCPTIDQTTSRSVNVEQTAAPCRLGARRCPRRWSPFRLGDGGGWWRIFCVLSRGCHRRARGADLAFLRYFVAACLLLPLLLAQGGFLNGRITWPRALVLAGLGGPVFSYLQVGGLQFAPLAHGSIIMPASVTLSSKLLLKQAVVSPIRRRCPGRPWSCGPRASDRGTAADRLRGRICPNGGEELGGRRHVSVGRHSLGHLWLAAEKVECDPVRTTAIVAVLGARGCYRYTSRRAVCSTYGKLRRL
jgi:hypothetical protein